MSSAVVDPTGLFWTALSLLPANVNKGTACGTAGRTYGVILRAAARPIRRHAPAGSRRTGNGESQHAAASGFDESLFDEVLSGRGQIVARQAKDRSDAASQNIAIAEICHRAHERAFNGHQTGMSQGKTAR